MRVFIVHAHPDPESFNAALTRTAVDALEADGHEVNVSDLYAMGFEGIADESHFPEPRAHPGGLRVEREQHHQWTTGTFPPDVRAEQEKLEWCDTLIFQFPIWWYSMPAMLRGWVERIAASGYAYGGGRKHAKGVFLGRRAMISCTTGSSAHVYRPEGIEGDITQLLWPINNGIFHYLGFDVLPPAVHYAPATVSETERAAMLDVYAERLRTLESTEPLFMHPAGDYDDDLRLRPGVEARSGFQWNPRAGQHRYARPGDPGGENLR